MDIARKIVRKRVDALTSDLDGPIEDAIKYLQELAARYPGAELEYEEVSSPYDHDIRHGLAIYIRRPETDEEIDRRLASENRARLQQEQSERRMYERLREKYGAEEGTK